MTVLDSLRSISGYPLSASALEMAAISRGLDIREEVTKDVAASDAYRLAKADVLMMLADAPDVTQEGISYSFTDEQAALTARQTVSAARKYIAALDEARKGYTQRGEMEQAGAISDEIRRVRLIPSVVAAEELLAKTSGQSGGALPAGAGFSGVPSVAELEQLRASRETLRQETESLDAKATEALGNWPQQYSAAVRALMERFRQSGNFNAWEAASGELARFEEQNTLHEEDVAEYPEGLRQTQEAFLQRLRAVAEERDAAKLKVYQAYLGKLEKLKSDLTKQGRMDAAAAVNLELRQIRKSPLYLSLSRLSAPEEPFVPEESQPPATQE